MTVLVEMTLETVQHVVGRRDPRSGGGFGGTDLNRPTGAGQTQFHTAGIAVFPSPQIVLKATWQKVINRDPAGANSDSVLGGVGFFF